MLPGFYAVNAVCSVACLAWIARGKARKTARAAAQRASWKHCLQKRIRTGRKLLWKSPRLSKGQIWDCGTDSVAIGYRHRQRAGSGMKGKPPLRRREAARVENKPDLSRKINQICRHQDCQKIRRFFGKGAAPRLRTSILRLRARNSARFCGLQYGLFR